MRFENEKDITVNDFVNLFIFGGDDKIYVNIAIYDSKNHCTEIILKRTRIISKEIQQYMDKRIEWLEEEWLDDLASITIMIEGDYNEIH